MKKVFQSAGDIIIGVAAVVAAITGLTFGVKICWTIVEFIWRFW